MYVIDFGIYCFLLVPINRHCELVSNDAPVTIMESSIFFSTFVDTLVSSGESRTIDIQLSTNSSYNDVSVLKRNMPFLFTCCEVPPLGKTSCVSDDRISNADEGKVPIPTLQLLSIIIESFNT